MKSSATLLSTSAFSRRCTCPYALGLAIILTGLVSGCFWERPHLATQGRDYEESYQYPLISPGTQFAALPPAVQNSIRAETGLAEISRVVKGTDSERIVYVVYFHNREMFPPLYIAPDGTVLSPNLSVTEAAPKGTVGALTGGPVTGLTLSDLPPKVVKTIQQRAPDAEIDFISKETHGDQTSYLIAFKNQARPKLHLAQDGTVLETSQ